MTLSRWSEPGCDSYMNRERIDAAIRSLPAHAWRPRITEWAVNPGAIALCLDVVVE